MNFFLVFFWISSRKLSTVLSKTGTSQCERHWTCHQEKFEENTVLFEKLSSVFVSYCDQKTLAVQAKKLSQVCQSHFLRVQKNFWWRIVLERLKNFSEKPFCERLSLSFVFFLGISARSFLSEQQSTSPEKNILQKTFCRFFLNFVSSFSFRYWANFFWTFAKKVAP